MMRLKQLLLPIKHFALVVFLCSFGLVITAQADVIQIDEYKRAIKADPKNFLAHLELGRAYQKLGLYEDEIAEYKEALR